MLPGLLLRKITVYVRGVKNFALSYVKHTVLGYDVQQYHSIHVMSRPVQTQRIVPVCVGGVAFPSQ